MCVPLILMCADNEEVAVLQVAIQDLENQIEEQKLKINNTAMPLLRVSKIAESALPANTLWFVLASVHRHDLRPFWGSLKSNTRPRLER